LEDILGSKMPKLKVKGLRSDIQEEVIDLEQARYFSFDPGVTVVAEGQVVHSYEELEKVASLETNKNKDFLEVLYLPVITGG
jgi:hypothetical protein